MSSRVHGIIWKHVLRLDSIGSSSDGSVRGSGISDGDGTCSINETISPLGSLNSS